MTEQQPNGRPRCGAKARHGGPCRRYSGAGTDHLGFGRCSNHGGATPAHRIHGAKELAKAEAARLGAEAPITAAEGLEWAIRLIGGEVRFLQAKVAEIEDGQVERDQLHPLAQALGGAAERLARVTKLGVDANLDSRRLELDALVLDRLGSAVSAAIEDAALDEDSRARLDAALRVRLGELSDDDLRPRPRELAA